MTIQQTVVIPSNHQLLVDVPLEVPVGKATLTLTAITANNDLEQARKIWSSNNRHQDEIKIKLQKLKGSLRRNAFGALDGVAYQHKVRKEWDD